MIRINILILSFLMTVLFSSQRAPDYQYTIDKVLSIQCTKPWTQQRIKYNPSISQTYFRYAGDETLLGTCQIAVELEPVKEIKLRQFSDKKRKILEAQGGFQIKKIITPSDGVIQLPYAIGYWCTYTKNERTYTVFILHAIHQNRLGLNMMFECRTEDFSLLENEWVYIVKNLQFIK